MEVFILSLAVFVGFVVQTVTGFGAGIMSLPILLLIFDLPQAVAFNSVFLVIFSAILVSKNHKEIDWKSVLDLGAGLLFGLILGVYLLKYSDPILLKRFLGIFIIFYVLY